MNLTQRLEVFLHLGVNELVFRTFLGKVYSFQCVRLGIVDGAAHVERE